VDRKMKMIMRMSKKSERDMVFRGAVAVLFADWRNRLSVSNWDEVGCMADFDSMGGDGPIYEIE